MKYHKYQYHKSELETTETTRLQFEHYCHQMDSFRVVLPPNLSADSISAVLQHVNSEQDHLVYGYGRQCHKHIPHNQLVIVTCLYYYFQLDTFCICDSFDQMNVRHGLKSTILSGLHSYGFKHPILLQHHVIVPLLNRHSIIMQTPSKTGATSALLIAALQILDLNEPQCQVLILTSRGVRTRLFVKSTLNALGKDLTFTSDNIESDAFYTEHSKAVMNDVQIITGTPDRLIDLVCNKDLKLNKLKLMALDSTDDIFSTGHSDQLYKIIPWVPLDAQIVLCCGPRLTKELQQFKDTCMRNPIQILAEKRIFKQFYVAVEMDYKLATLSDVLEAIDLYNQRIIIYCNTNRKVNWLMDKCKSADNVLAMHGDITSAQRERNLKTFKSNSGGILVATDTLLGCGEMGGYDLLINYDFPRNKEEYERRTGMYGVTNGARVVISFICDAEEPKLRIVEDLYDTTIKELPQDIASIFKEST
eukprot:566849_1